jgi:hypothetical protein
LNAFGFVRFLHFKTASFRTVFIGLDLQRTFTGLVTDRTVEWVIYKDKFKIVLLSPFNLFIHFLRFDDHAITDIHLTGWL